MQAGNNPQFPPGGPRRPPTSPPSYQVSWGEPIAPQTPTPTPLPQPVKTKEMIRPKSAGMIVLIGVIIFFVGIILVQFTALLEYPDDDDYDDSEKYADAVEAYQDTTRNLFGIGRIVNWLGAMIIAIPLYVIGISSEKLDWKVRASMLSAATALVIATMFVSLFTLVTSY